jgi:hypothetical protein
MTSWSGRVTFKRLIGRTPKIYQSNTFKRITYYHIELEMHSIISASGIMAESMFEGHEKMISL